MESDEIFRVAESGLKLQLTKMPPWAKNAHAEGVKIFNCDLKNRSEIYILGYRWALIENSIQCLKRQFPEKHFEFGLPFQSTQLRLKNLCGGFNDQEHLDYFQGKADGKEKAAGGIGTWANFYLIISKHYQEFEKLTKIEIHRWFIERKLLLENVDPRQTREKLSVIKFPEGIAGRPKK